MFMNSGPVLIDSVQAPVVLGDNFDLRRQLQGSVFFDAFCCASGGKIRLKWAGHPLYQQETAVSLELDKLI